MTYEKLWDLWPSLSDDDQRRLVDPDRDDPEWLDELDLSPWYQEKLRELCEHELEVMQKEAERRDGHPEYGTDYTIESEPDEQYGGFNRVIRPTEESEDSEDSEESEESEDSEESAEK